MSTVAYTVKTRGSTFTVKTSPVVLGGDNGLPTGGSSGQALVKNSATDYDVTWATVSGVGGGSVATDVIWDAAGDLAVGTGANTAARLALGGAGDLFMVSGSSVAWKSNPSYTVASTDSLFTTQSSALSSYAAGLVTTESGLRASADALKAPLASPTFTGTVTLPTGLTGVIRADSGVVSVDSDVTDIVSAASDTAAGKVELATTAEAITGTDTARAVTPAGLQAAQDDMVSSGTAILASLIPIADIANDFTATNVEDALAELQSDAEAHLADTSAAHAASAISYTAGGTVSATDVQAAIAEVASEKAPLASPTFTGDVVVPDADAATEAMNRQTSDTRYLMKAFGTTTQTIENTAGRRITIENDNSFATNDIKLRVYLDSNDANPVFSEGTLLGVVNQLQLGLGDATALDTSITRGAAALVRVGGYLMDVGGSATEAGRAKGRMTSNITAVGNVGTGEDTLQTKAVSAATLNTDGQLLRVVFRGTAANNANAKRLRFKWAAVTVLDTGALPTSEAYTWKAEMVIVRTGATTQDVFCSFVAGSATPVIKEAAMAAGGATLANANNVFVTGEAVSNNDLVSELLTVDWEGAAAAT